MGHCRTQCVFYEAHDVCPPMCVLWAAFESQQGATCRTRATVNEAAELQESSDSREEQGMFS